MKIEILILHNLTYQVSSHKIKIFGNENALRMLKGIYTNKFRFIERYLSAYKNIALLEPLYNYFKINYDRVTPFTYKEAFKLKDEEFRAMVFGTIDINEMIRNLGAVRIKTDGKEVTRKCFDKQGNSLPNKSYHAVYETYEMDCSKLFTDSERRSQQSLAYAVKCWCTSTHQEHWIWIEERYKDNPLEAIASTFRFHKNVIPHIKELKRQGDIMLVELNEEIEPKGEIIPLTATQYFGLLTIET